MPGELHQSVISRVTGVLTLTSGGGGSPIFVCERLHPSRTTASDKTSKISTAPLAFRERGRG